MLPPPIIKAPPPAQNLPTAQAQNAVKPANNDISPFYEALVNGNLAQLNQEEQSRYLTNICEKMGLNPLTRPFAFIKLNGKLTVYALKEASAQLARRDSVSVALSEYRFLEEHNILECTARASTSDGRFTDEIAAVVFSKKSMGEDAANARMKLATKAKRRAILSHCGLGFLDESELETTQNRVEVVNERTTNRKSISPKAPISSAVSETPQAALEQNKTNGSAGSNRGDDTNNSAPITVDTSFADNSQRELPLVETNLNAFDFNKDLDKAWLIGKIRAECGDITRAELIALAQSCKDCQSKIECLDVIARSK